MRKDSYISIITDEWWANSKEVLSESNLKSYIIKDLISIGVDVTNISFYIKIYGIQKINIRLYYNNEYTMNVMTMYTKLQLERKAKLNSIGIS